MQVPKHSGAGTAVVAQLCPHCALCCSGVLFRDVELKPGDDPVRLKALGLPLSPKRPSQSGRRPQKFPQPCAALAGCDCRIYPGRPVRCREFECALLKSVSAGETETAPALRVIRDARARAEKVRRLLRRLGDEDEHLALSVRFRRMQRRMESIQVGDETVEVFSQLTLAVHDLNLAMRAKFYPG